MIRAGRFAMLLAGSAQAEGSARPPGSEKLAEQPGFGPVRQGEVALCGAQEPLAEPGPNLRGVIMDSGWTHADAS